MTHQLKRNYILICFQRHITSSQEEMKESVKQLKSKVSEVEAEMETTSTERLPNQSNKLNNLVMKNRVNASNIEEMKCDLDNS